MWGSTLSVLRQQGVVLYLTPPIVLPLLGRKLHHDLPILYTLLHVTPPCTCCVCPCRWRGTRRWACLFSMLYMIL